MKFGYFANANNLRLEKPFHQVLDEIREIAVTCEDAGWESIWFTEHHFGHEGFEVCPNPLMMGADIAARTKRIRIGQAANIVTFWHPLRLAEDIAMLDHMCGGRLDIGVGRGLYGREAVNLNKMADPRDEARNRAVFEETVAILKEALSKPYFAHAGEIHTYPDPGYVWDHAMSPKSSAFMDLDSNEMTRLALVPRALQEPHPPLWQVIDSPRSIKWAAENDLKGILWLPTVGSLKERFELYRVTASAAQARPFARGEGLALLRDLYVAETMEEAERDASQGILDYLHWICHWRGLGNFLDPGEELPPGPKLDALSYSWLHPRNLLFGTPDYVAERIEELRSELGLEYLLLWSSYPGVPHEKVMRSLTLFNEEVLPRFKGGFGAAGQAAS